MVRGLSRGDSVSMGNSAPSMNFPSRSDESFSGEVEAIQWIQFLKSVKTVYLSGEKIDTRYFQAISHLNQLQNIKLRHVRLRQRDIKLLYDLMHLEHLGINYIDIGDSFLPALAKLQLSSSLRLYGTQITPTGANQLAAQLDGIEISCLRGGFLGVGTDPASTLIRTVTENSAAQKAGLRLGDIIKTINGVPIKDFFQLRRELGKCVPGDRVKIDILRAGQPLELQATLDEEPG